MPVINKPSFFRRLIKSRLLIVAEIGLLILISIALGKEVIRKYQINNQINDLKSEIEELEQGNIELSGLIDYFNSETYKEGQARLKLGLQKPGESVVSVPNSEGQVMGAQVVAGERGSIRQTQENNNQSNPQRWWNYFFKLKIES